MRNRRPQHTPRGNSTVWLGFSRCCVPLDLRPGTATATSTATATPAATSSSAGLGATRGTAACAQRRLRSADLVRANVIVAGRCGGGVSAGALGVAAARTQRQLGPADLVRANVIVARLACSRGRSGAGIGGGVRVAACIALLHGLDNVVGPGKRGGEEGRVVVGSGQGLGAGLGFSARLPSVGWHAHLAHVTA